MFENIKCVLFDLDGTIYLGNTLIEGAVEVVERFRSMGKEICFLTNNSAKSRKQIWEKLTNMGLVCKDNEVYSSGYVAAVYAQQQKYKSMYVCGTDSLRSEFINMGIEISSEADVITIGYDPDFNYEKLTEALQVSFHAHTIIACNKELHYPGTNGKQFPGCGAMVGAFEGSTGRTVDYIVGKPNPRMLDIICKDKQYNHSSILMIGDSLTSDINMAIRYGSDAIYIGNEDKKDIKRVEYIKDILQML